MTPYKAAQVLNSVLVELEIDFEIRPQMIYNYCGKSYIKAGKTADGKWDVAEEDLFDWFKKYVEKKYKVVYSIDEVEDDKIEGQEELDLESAMN